MVEQRILDEVALTHSEYDLVVDLLGREPTDVELGMFGALWSEHCGYKNSKPLLRLFPTTGVHVLQGPGENAGAVDIGDGLAVVLKMESHNHPSAIEPYQGAATGVGGIVRDIFTMGARPIAVLDSLRFGPLDQPRNRYLFAGVVSGIAGYGNCIGVPTVGGEVYFAPSYSGNPLVNVMAVGLIASDGLVKAVASGAGNLLMLVGADTGRDGIHGATFASVELNEKSEERRPAVQVGNPFLEKLLIEACLEVARSEHVVGMQDLGAAGLTSSVVESASKGGCGADIDVGKVSRREQHMTPYEVMLSESQERMLVVVKRGREAEVGAIFERWGLHWDIIGSVTGDSVVTVRDNGAVVASIPTELLMNPPIYERQGECPDSLKAARAVDPDAFGPPQDLTRVLLMLLASPNIARKDYVYSQYDHMVQTNTIVPPGKGDAAILRVKGTDKAIALTTDCNSRLCYLDPVLGGASAVAEAARNLVCSGAEPLALTDCLNFGNPERPEIYYQLEGCVRGIARACSVLGVPVVSGNVSLYNETNGQAVDPTPVVGMVGLIKNADRACAMGFQFEGDIAVLLGSSEADSLGGSQVLETLYGVVGGEPPQIDLDMEKRVQSACLQAASQGMLRSAHDCSDGGLAVCLAESCVTGGLGLRVTLPSPEAGAYKWLFHEAPSRIVVSVAKAQVETLLRLAALKQVPATAIGVVGGPNLVWPGVVDATVESMQSAWHNGLVDHLTGSV